MSPVITDRLAAYDAYRKEEPKTKVDALADDWLEQLAKPDCAQS